MTGFASLLAVVLIILCAERMGSWIRTHGRAGVSSELILGFLGTIIVGSTVFLVYQFAVWLEGVWPAIYVWWMS